MIAIISALVESIRVLLELAVKPDPEAERQELLRINRVISDEIARRELA